MLDESKYPGLAAAPSIRVNSTATGACFGAAVIGTHIQIIASCDMPGGIIDDAPRHIAPFLACS